MQRNRVPNPPHRRRAEPAPAKPNTITFKGDSLFITFFSVFTFGFICSLLFLFVITPPTNFPVVVPRSHMTEASQTSFLRPDTVAYCRANMTLCLFDGLAVMPVSYSTNASSQTLSVSFNDDMKIIMPVTNMVLSTINSFVILTGICLVYVFIIMRLVYFDNKDHSQRANNIFRCFDAAVHGKYAVGYLDGIDIACSPAGLQLIVNGVVCLKNTRFVVATRPFTPFFKKNVSLSAALNQRNTPNVRFCVTSRVALEWRENGALRIWLDNVAYDAVAEPEVHEQASAAQ